MMLMIKVMMPEKMIAMNMMIIIPERSNMATVRCLAPPGNKKFVNEGDLDWDNLQKSDLDLGNP